MNAVRTAIRTALNASQPAGKAAQPAESLALNLKLTAEGNAPDTIPLIPAPGAEGLVVGEDGRFWYNQDPQAVVERFSRPLPIDINHATETRAHIGGESPAAGWITSIEAHDDGSIWGAVEWTEEGANQVKQRAYRYISPVFTFTREGKQIVQLKSAGLVNSPNFDLALNNAESEHSAEETSEMDREQLINLLGLAANATDAQILAAIKQLQTAANGQQQPSLDKFVPRADYDAQVEKAKNAQAELARRDNEARQAEIDAVIDAALNAGKIPPASVDYHKAQCAQEGGLDRFKQLVGKLPEIAGDSGLGDRKPEKEGETALNAEEQKLADMLGNTAEDLTKYAS